MFRTRRRGWRGRGGDGVRAGPPSHEADRRGRQSPPHLLLPGRLRRQLGAAGGDGGGRAEGGVPHTLRLPVIDLLAR